MPDQDVWGMMRVPFAGMVYRIVMLIAHTFNWHYAPEFGPLEDGRYQRWCHWCGMRDTYFKHKEIIYDDTAKHKQS